MKKQIPKLFLLLILTVFLVPTIYAVQVESSGAGIPSVPGAPLGFKGGHGNKTLGKHIACVAISKNNTRYSLGGRSVNAFDCTGFTHYALTQVGILWPYVNSKNTTIGSGSSYSARTMASENLMLDCTYLEPGDLIYLDYYRKWNLHNAPHVGIYLGGGNFIHATSHANRVKVDNFKTAYNKKGQVLGCARPYTRYQESEYEEKNRNFNKTVHPVEGYNFAFEVSKARKQTNYIYWDEWGCEDTIINGGPISFQGGTTIYIPPSESSLNEAGYLEIIDHNIEGLYEITPLSLDNEFKCSGLLGHINNKEEPAYWIQMALNIIRILAIAALLLLSTIDLIKATSSQNEDSMKKAIKTTLKRFLYTIILFFLPILLNILMGYIDVYGNDYNADCQEVIK